MPTGFARRLMESTRPDPLITVTEWADRFRYLPQESAKEYGLYNSQRTPYVREIMDELSPQSKTTEVVFVKPTQIGATEVGNNLLFCIADIFPAPCMFALPTEAMAKRHSKKRIAPSLKLIDTLKEKIKEPRSRDSGNTILQKEFPGGSWVFTGSNSPVSARSEAIKVLVLDDYDGFEEDIGGEGEPGDLFIRRTDTFGDSKKIYKNSTPTIRDFSSIEREYNESSKGFFKVPCPHCGEFIKLLWAYLKFKRWSAEYNQEYLAAGGSKDDIRNDGELDENSVYLECPECKGEIFEYQKTKMLSAGKWVHEFPKNRKRGFKINGLYSPLGWVSWVQIINEFLAAQGKITKLKVWTNTRMADTFEERGTRPSWGQLKARGESYKEMTVPAGGRVLVMGVDTHLHRLDYVIRAFGVDEESWLIKWGHIFGDLTQNYPWKELDQLIEFKYPHESGGFLQMASVSVDAMGHYTKQVYDYARTRFPIVAAVRGSTTKIPQIVGRVTRPEVDARGHRLYNSIMLWHVGTDQAKATIYRRLGLIDPGAGYYHFPIGIPDEYFEQLTAEKLMVRFVKGFPKEEWVLVSEGMPNHALDCEVYAYHAALRRVVSFRGAGDDVAGKPTGGGRGVRSRGV